MAARVGALLVTRERPPARTRRVDGPAGEVDESAVFVHDLDDMADIIFPVGRQENARVRAQFSAQHGHELRTHQTAFVMALLRPGVGKEYIHTGEALIAHLTVDEAGRIPTQNAYVLQLAFSKPAQETPEPRAVNLDAEVVILRMLARQRDQDLARAAADFQITFGVTAEGGAKIEWFRARPDAEALGPRGQGLLLRRGDAPLAAHIAADRTAG